MRLTSPCLEAALAYAAAGWAVLPLHTPERGGCSCGCCCGSVGKHPLTAHGVKDASIDPARISSWWQRWPQANVGIATGAASGLVVLDVDVRHAGERSLGLLQQQHAPLPPTLTSATGGGGWHLFFRSSPDCLVRNATALLGLPGLDVRSEGGYVVAAPSRHASGACYHWVERQTPVASLPPWLRSLLLAHPFPRCSHTPVRPLSPQDPAARWLAQALERVHVGVRNEMGFWLACQLRDAGLDLLEAEEVLRAYAAQAPPGNHPYLVREALASLHSAYQQPRRVSARRKLA